MSNDIIFDENKYKIKSRSLLGQAEVPGMTKFLMRKGIVKNEKSANALLFAIITLSLLASAFVLMVFVFDMQIGNSNTASPEKIQAGKERLQQVRQERDLNKSNAQNQQ